MTLTKFCQNFYPCPSFLELMQIKCKFFLIDSLAVTLQIHMFNISSLLNAPKIEKKLKMGSKLMKHPLPRITSFEKSLLLQFHEVKQCETHITLKVSNSNNFYFCL